MDYQKFIGRLPELYDNWGLESVQPKSNQFHFVLNRVPGMTTPNILQLLNWAVECMEEDEVYCEVGCFHGSTLIGALLNHPDKMAYAVDNFSEFDESGQNFEQLSQNLAHFGLDEQVVFCNQDFEEFFFELKEVQPKPKIGVYLYDGAHDYRSQILGLLLVKPFLAEKALIIVDDSNWSNVYQANWDFMVANPQCQLLMDLPTPEKQYLTNQYKTFWNGIQIFSWDKYQNNNYTWTTITKKFRHKPIIKSLHDFYMDFEFFYKDTKIKSLEKEALELEFSNQLLASEKKYQEILEWTKDHANTYYNLGMIYQQMARYQDAISMFSKYLELKPDGSLAYYSLGLVLETIGKIHQAIWAYEQTIEINPQLIDAYNNLGNILLLINHVERAEAIYRQAIATNPNHFGSYLNLGNLLMSKQQVDAAIDAYQKALELKPNHPDILNNLGVALKTKGEVKADLYLGDAAYYGRKFEEAIAHYQDFLNQETGDINLYINLADCYQLLNQQSAAIDTCQQGLKRYPHAANIYLKLIRALQLFGKIQEAIAVATEASQLLPDELALKLEKQRLLPNSYKNKAEIDFYRARFTQELNTLIEQTSLDTPLLRKNALKGIGYRTNLQLPYQGQNDLELQRQYGKFVHKIMAANYPEWTRPLSISALEKSEKIRVGYISIHLRNNSGAKWLLGWLKNINREKFQTYCYYIGTTPDSITQKFQIYSDVFHHIPEDLEAVCQQIVADQLHLIVYPDIGQNPQTTQMAGLRLAPIQCTAWGHPVTSGLPTIDYYISSQLMEPPNAQEHYLEKLVKLPNLGFSYPKPELPQTREERSYFNIDKQAVVYLSCQSLPKYLPQYDYIFPTIARNINQAKFVFIKDDVSPGLNDKFSQRLQKAFAEFGLNSEEYCLFLPPLSHTDYLHLNLVADVFLDTLSWSGANTTLEAIACNLPIVTCPGEFMRGRHSYGILQMLGVTETIAKNEAEYIDIAVRLGLDQQWRESIRSQVRQNQDRVYDDQSCVEALEMFYQQVIKFPQLLLY